MNLEELVQTVKYFLGSKKNYAQNSACICACEISKKCQNLFQSHVAVESQHGCIFLMTHSVGRVWDGCSMKMDNQNSHQFPMQYREKKSSTLFNL